MITKISSYLDDVSSAVKNLDKKEIETLISLLIKARDNNKRIYIMGNGGSGATASHFCCDFNKGMSYGRKKRFRMFCLNDNVPTMLAYSNDISYDDVFLEQLKNFLDEGDTVIGISGSGNSKNVLKAIEYANSKNAITIAITGFDGGKLKKIAKYSINANVFDMQLSEDIHMMLCHLMYRVINSFEDKE